MLDFSKRKKRYYDITLHDGTTLKIPAPKNSLWMALAELQASGPMENVGNLELLRLTRIVLESNKESIPITDQHINEFDLEDMQDFLGEYAGFVNSILSDPN